MPRYKPVDFHDCVIAGIVVILAPFWLPIFALAVVLAGVGWVATRVWQWVT